MLASRPTDHSSSISDIVTRGLVTDSDDPVLSAVLSLSVLTSKRRLHQPFKLY